MRHPHPVPRVPVVARSPPAINNVYSGDLPFIFISAVDLSRGQVQRPGTTWIRGRLRSIIMRRQMEILAGRTMALERCAHEYGRGSPLKLSARALASFVRGLFNHRNGAAAAGLPRPPRGTFYGVGRGRD
jgi:hypothetical protein